MNPFDSDPIDESGLSFFRGIASALALSVLGGAVIAAVGALVLAWVTG
jgi:hypothetical protein